MRNVGEAYPQCPICSREETVFVSKHTDFPGTGIWFCNECNHWFGYPEPERLELNSYYKDVYSPRRSIYTNEEYCVSMERRAEAQIRFIEEWLLRSGLPGNFRGWRILDWGCGIGALVALLQRLGADALGFDSDLEIIKIGQKRWAANISTSLSQDMSALQGQFDLLLLSHVIEHLSNIRESLQDVLGVLKPGGFVFIEVPNSSAELFLVPFDPESHLHFFSRQSLMHILNGLGVQVLICVSSGPLKTLSNPLDKNSVVSNYGKRTLRKVKARLGKIVRPFGIGSNDVKTIYDGYYEYYPEEDNGLWLRCLGQVQ